MRRMVLLLGGVAGILAATVACSWLEPPFCPNGVLPFDGQTAVPLDAVIVVQTGAALPADVPSLDGTITLRAKGRGPVPFHTEVDPSSGEIRVVPDEPLEPGTRYELGAVDWFELAEYPHWWGEADFGRDYTVTTFTTASRPALLDVAPSGDDDGTLVLAFSEPVDLDSLDGRLRGSTSGTPTTGGDGELAVLGHFDGDDHLVWAEPLGDEALDLDGGQVWVLEGARAASGEPVLASEPVPIDLADDGAAVQRVSGAPYCLPTDEVWL